MSSVIRIAGECGMNVVSAASHASNILCSWSQIRCHFERKESKRRRRKSNERRSSLQRMKTSRALYWFDLTLIDYAKSNLLWYFTVDMKGREKRRRLTVSMLSLFSPSFRFLWFDLLFVCHPSFISIFGKSLSNAISSLQFSSRRKNHPSV
jgi:hypothetical protein